MLRNIWVTILVLWTTQALGQDRWSLEQCIQYAMENNIQIKQSELDKEIADVNLFGSRMRSLPDLNANASYSTSKGRSVDPFTNIIVDREIQSQRGGVNASVPVFNGFQIRNSVKRDEQGLLAATYDLEAVKNDVTLNVVTFYTNILFNRELVDIAGFRLETTSIQEEQIDKQVELGSLPIANLLQIRQQLANDELELIRAQNNLELSVLQLKQALQIPADVQFEIQTPELPDPQTEVLVESSSQVYLYALKNQPLIKAAEARTERADFGIGVAKSNYYPSINVNAGISTAYSSVAAEQLPDFSYLDQLDANQQQFVGVSLNIPIFNKFQVRNNVQQAVINGKRSEYQLINSKNQLQQTIEQAYLDVKSAAKAYSALENSLSAAQLAFENAEQRLQLGATNAVEYTQVKNDFERVKSDLVRAKYDYIFKLKVLDFYQGKPLNF